MDAWTISGALLAVAIIGWMVFDVITAPIVDDDFDY